MTNHAQGNPIDRFLAELASGSGISPEIYTDDAYLDATVPDWRFEKRGPQDVADQLSHWYDTPTVIETTHRHQIPGGEVVELEISGEQDGVPYAAHQVHLISLVDGRISADTVWCGGRWPADRLAEMEEARAR